MLTNFIIILSLFIISISPIAARLTTINEEQQNIQTIEQTFEKKGFKKLVSSVSPAVVLIYTINSSAKDDWKIYNSSIKPRTKNENYRNGVISGVVISDTGIIVTTYNSIQRSEKIIVSINSEKRTNHPDDDDCIIKKGRNDYEAEIIKTIPELNLAFLKIDTKGKKIQYLELGNDTNLISGKNKILRNGAIAIGKAKGHIAVSEKHPALSKNKFEICANGIETLSFKKQEGIPTLLIQNEFIGSGVIPENEGGAIVDEGGKLIGIACNSINDFSFTTSTGIPVSVVKQGAMLAAPQILKYSGNTKLGIDANDINSPNKELSKKLTQAKKSIGIMDNINIGIRVKSVHVNSPADKAGIMPGDIILTHNKDVVTNTKEFDNLQKYSIGNTTTTLKILRDETIIESEIFK